MVIKRLFNTLLYNRKGTAEIIGSVMFLVILLFFFTNVYMWHDGATREMNTVLSEKTNSQISADWFSTTEHEGLLNVTNNGGSGVALSRLWVTSAITHQHFYAELEDQNIWVAAGETVTIEVGGAAGYDGTRPLEVVPSGQNIRVDYDAARAESFKVLTVRGNTAACSYTPLMKGSLTVVEVARPDYPLANFNFSGTGDIGNFTLYSYGDTTLTLNLAPGTYNITQVDRPSGWDLTGIFGDAIVDVPNGNAMVTVAGGESYEVRFVNEPPPPPPG
jgi:hypothetical protein